MRSVNHIMISLVTLAIISMTCGCNDNSQGNEENTGLPVESSLTEQVDTTDSKNTEIIKSNDLKREEEYNTIEVLFSSLSGSAIPMDIEIFSIYSNTEAYYTLDEAVDAGAVKRYNNKDGRMTMLLKEGFAFNGLMTPTNKDSLKGWAEYKGKYPFEIVATLGGSNRLTQFQISLNYASDTVSTQVKTFDFN